MKKRVKLFFDLAKENPDLPVVPFVDGAVVSEDKCAAFIGDFGASRVGEFWNMTVNIELAYVKCLKDFKENEQWVKNFILSIMGKISSFRK